MRLNGTCDGEAKDEGPEAGGGMVLDSLPESHVVLTVLGLLRVGHMLLGVVLVTLEERDIAKEVFFVAVVGRAALRRILDGLSKARHFQLVRICVF